MGFHLVILMSSDVAGCLRLIIDDFLKGRMSLLGCFLWLHRDSHICLYQFSRRISGGTFYWKALLLEFFKHFPVHMKNFHVCHVGLFSEHRVPSFPCGRVLFLLCSLFGNTSGPSIA